MSSSNKEYDVIIAGGGPAGLSAAREISKNKKLKILLLEKGNIGKTKIAWSCWPEQLNDFGLYDAISNIGKEMIYFAPNGFRLSMKANLATANEEKLLSLILDEIDPAYCDIMDKCELINYIPRKKEGIIINTNKGTFKGRLLIDACGFNSPSSQKYLLQNNKWKWQNLVYIFNDVSRDIKLDEFFFYDRRINTENKPIFWMEPYSKKQVLLGVYYLVKVPLDEKIVSEELEKYKKLMQIDGQLEKVCEGMIPLYFNQPIVFDNVILIGASGGMISPGTAFGLYSSLNDGKLVAEYLNNFDEIPYKNKRFQKLWWKKNRINFTFGQISLFDQMSNHDPKYFNNHLEYTKEKILTDKDLLIKWQKDKTDIDTVKKFLKLAPDKLSIKHLLNNLERDDFLKLFSSFVKIKYYIHFKK